MQNCLIMFHFVVRRNYTQYWFKLATFSRNLDSGCLERESFEQNILSKSTEELREELVASEAAQFDVTEIS